ncbi:amidohydrolase [Halioglobus maricola]|uniref:Omega-amidase YafV n=1 Tax=Halioglobus maricola TaxID=2601894 RepID=A0A5P9NH86_9GAMM|nr:amidohydrolase [Halioglobus maricola]QFU74876.1 amidohydrolase [Halioglobus maricola]
MQDITVALVQRELAWESPEDNRKQIGDTIAGLAPESDLIVLPEMFTTGFSMNALANAERPGGATEQWMRELAGEHNCAITGSIAVTLDASTVYNRMLFVTADSCEFYDKRHLFRMAGEHKRYGDGKERVVVTWRGWRILLQVCYDLRFPVFSRNRDDYDMALYVANWPDSRALHWRSLLVARAIENQACVVGVNRIGKDANKLSYSGDSLAVKADGTLAADMADANTVSAVTFSGDELAKYRQRFPFAMDADKFELT